MGGDIKNVTIKPSTFGLRTYRPTRPWPWAHCCRGSQIKYNDLEKQLLCCEGVQKKD